MGMCKFSNLTGKGMCRGLCDYFHLFPSKMNMNLCKLDKNFNENTAKFGPFF